MAANRDLARRFDEMGQALELLGANPFRANAHARVARTLRELPEEAHAIVSRDPATAESRLAALPGIGRSSAARIVQFVRDGRIDEHEELLARIPRGLFELLAVPGLGPKAVRAMWEELGITCLADLEVRIDSPELAALPRMGPKSVDNLRKALAFAREASERTSIGIALPLARNLAAELGGLPGVERITYAGSLRRGCETIGDLDFVAVCSDPGALREGFLNHALSSQVLASGPTKCSVRLRGGRFALQADLRLVPASAWGAALLYFTGSKEHNVRLRERAIARGLHLNEYGLFSGTAERPQERGETPVAAATEEEIYAALELPFVPPELREDRGELAGPLPRLIEESDLGAELHAHTRASDGRLEILELARLAKKRGLHTLAITDHSQSQTIANGLDPERLRRHLAAVRAAADEVPGLRLLAGAEVDVLPDGTLDYDDDTLALLDIVVAAPHAALRQDPDAATRRLIAAIRHPRVAVLAHPTGRILGRREGLSPDLDALFTAAAERRVALEVNANPKRLDLRDHHVRAALDRGCLIAIDTDAHDEADLDHRSYGVLTARRGGLDAERCVNAWAPERLAEWLAARHPSSP